jgi:phenylacetate-CoA ligase
MAKKPLRIVNPALELASRKDYQALIERRLVAQVRRAYARIPFYKARFPAQAANISSYAEFRDIIPFQAKPDMLIGGADYVVGDRLANPCSEVVNYHMTSGTTGLGQEVHPLTKFDQEAMGAPWVYQAHWAGMELGDSIVHTFPVGMQTGGMSSFPMGERMASLIMQFGPYGTEKKVDYLLKFRPNGMIISPAYLTRLQAIFEERNLNPREVLPGFKSVFVAGENYSEDWAARTMEFWGCNISEWYGLMQGGMNQCFSCEHGVLRDGKRAHLHAMEHRILSEILRPGTSDPVEPGEEGELVCTSLCREAFPIIRFRTGDRVRLMAEPCDCGRPMIGIEAGTVARYDDMMKIRAQNLWPDAVDKIVFEKGDVEEYAGLVYVDKDGRETVEMSVELKPDVPKDEAARSKRMADLAQEIKAKLNVQMDVREVPYLSIPRFEFKTRRWTDERRKGREFVRYVKS